MEVGDIGLKWTPGVPYAPGLHVGEVIDDLFFEHHLEQMWKVKRFIHAIPYGFSYWPQRSNVLKKKS